MSSDIALDVPRWVIAPLAVLVAGSLLAAFDPSLLWVLLGPFGVLVSAVTVIDLRELRIPNSLLAVAGVIGVPLLLLASRAEHPDLSLWRAVAAAVALFAFYLALSVLSRGGIGMGDVKFALLLGAQLGLFGWFVLVRAVLITHVLAGVVALALLVSGRAGRRSGLPFGPFMGAGGVIALILEGVTSTGT